MHVVEKLEITEIKDLTNTTLEQRKQKKRKQDQKLLRLTLSKRSKKEKEMSAVEKTRSIVNNASPRAQQKLIISGRDKANSQTYSSYSH